MNGPHGGAERLVAFERSEFCAGCHQFPREAAVNGKALENTFVEWQASPFAAQGRTCQSCHMPGRQHLFRGIHDPEMVASGLATRIETSPERVRFSLTSSAVGHAFPTYTTPRVALRSVALDRSGGEVAGTEREHVIQRRVSVSSTGWIEHSDTRLLPGETASLDSPWQGYDAVKIWLEVFPDNFYQREVYPELLKDLKSGSPAWTLIKQAIERAERSKFRLFEQVVRRPR